MEDKVKLVADNLEKPDLDNRSYRVIELPNRLEALLVHDPDTDKASASLNVNVGNFSDDDDMPGMAHAVEHLLFMGTEKYPVENEYSSYLSANSGYSNAYTAATQTNYFFECAAANEDQKADTNGVNGQVASMPNGTSTSQRGPFYGALDRFAQFFVKPLFLESTLDRELRAVDSENKKNLQSDGWRLSQLSKSLSNPAHPYHHFSTGNLKTLKDDPTERGVKIRDAFIQFYEKHYSANRMKLVVLGQESLDELESWVVELFSEVKNKNLPENRWDDVQLWSEPQLKTEIFAKPVMEARTLEISFPYQDEDSMYETQPSRFLSHLIGHEGPGSILAYLKEQGLAHSLSSGSHVVCPGSAFFDIEIGLTPEGLTRYRDIVKIVFQYIGLIRENPPVEWMFQELKNMAEVDFRFRQKSPASRFASSTSSTMQKSLPRNWLLSGFSKFRKFDAKAVVNALQYLREDNFRLMIVSQDYPGDWNEKEKWYGTEYKVEKIKDEQISQIRQALASKSTERPAELHLPHKNEFIPTQLDVEKVETKTPSKAPRLLRNDDKMRLWWKKDDTFWVPKANVYVTLRSPVVYRTSADHVKALLYANLVRDALNEYAYDADISGLSYNIWCNTMGIDLSFHGYNDKMSVLLAKVLQTMRDLEYKQDRFDVSVDRLSRELKDFGFRQPYQQISDFTRYLVDDRRYLTPRLADELPGITLSSVKDFASELLSKLHTEIFVHGNMYKSDAHTIAEVVQSSLKADVLPTDQFPRRRNIIVPPGSNYVYNTKVGDPENINTAIEYLLNIGPNTDYALRAKLLMIAQMTDEPSFDQLRTKEQLGYVVWSGKRSTATTLGYRVLIQSERSPEYLEGRIDAFLTKFKADLATMSQEEFEKHRRSLIQRRLEKVKNLNSESSKLFHYIECEQYQFFQVDTDVEHIRKLTKEDCIQFFNQYIDPVSPTRAKLSIHMHAQKKATEDISRMEQKSQLVGVLSQYLTAQGAETSSENLTSALANAAIHDSKAVLTSMKTAIGSALPENRVAELSSELEKALPQVFAALKIKAPEQEQELEQPPVVSKPVLIEDVISWRNSMKKTVGVEPIEDISQFVDPESKL